MTDGAWVGSAVNREEIRALIGQLFKGLWKGISVRRIRINTGLRHAVLFTVCIALVMIFKVVVLICLAPIFGLDRDENTPPDRQVFTIDLFMCDIYFVLVNVFQNPVFLTRIFSY